jgi:hypothetical protein
MESAAKRMSVPTACGNESEDLRFRHTEHGRCCGICWGYLCIICRSMPIARVQSLQFLQKRGVVESLTGNHTL